ncbi:MmgE/PrpD family protein [Hyphococcus luteus]|uniref:MmgE/PrpD family protein n=1 Tax=Hyphococcus luteus TaxID=2058213 RepID=A0A2S7K5A0_9PROT|nr:MmgE/PrpD family protein [Marinicaulis flavus]PQA87669.1 hypothetical protein CW354_11380 [Marinicaulis flavus]
MNSSDRSKLENRNKGQGANSQSSKVDFKYKEDRGGASADNPAETAAIANHVARRRFEDIPGEDVAKAKLRVLDLVGCAIGGVNGEGNDALVRSLDLAGSAPRASVIGFGARLSSGDAALANAVISRSYDFEVMTVVVDGAVIGSHNSPTTCMTALALADEHALSGRDFLAALIIGDDIAARTLAASGLDLGAGWDASSIFTAVPAAAIAAKLMRLDARQTRDAMGHAVDMISGTTQSVWDGVQSWKLVGGLAAKNGIFAAQLASTGAWPAMGDALLAPYGFFGQFTTGCINPSILTKGLGETYYGEEYFKPYPSCAATQAIHECALDACGEKQFAPDEIEAISVRMPAFILGTALALPFAPARDDHTRANFSIRYQIASAVLRGPIKQEHYSESAIHSPDVAAMLQKIELLPAAEESKELEVTIRLNTGQKNSAMHSGVPWRHPSRSPFTANDVQDKFHQQAAFTGRTPKTTAQEIVERIMALEEEKDMSAFAEFVARSALPPQAAK